MPEPRQTMGQRILDAVIPTIISAIVATPVATWLAARTLGVLETRVSVVETRVGKIEADIVPRKEHEAHWKAQEDAQLQILGDLREIRREQQRKGNP